MMRMMGWSDGALGSQKQGREDPMRQTKSLKWTKNQSVERPSKPKIRRLNETETVSRTLFEVEETDKEVTVQQLIIKQISLGAEANSGEFNVVQAEKETLKIPVAVLKAGETRVLRPNLEFPSDSVTFNLTQGNGPVYISWKNVVSEIMNEEWNDDDDIEDDDDDDEPPPSQQNGVNTLLQNPCMQGVPSGKTSGGSTRKQVSLILMRQHL
uniref:Nucleoplasmin core domain-containing protein n=1 Tax=Glossina palpalis gambiensis TaxID=67801 RepID=A0A1B0BZY7_9MUSC